VVAGIPEDVIRSAKAFWPTGGGDLDQPPGLADGLVIETGKEIVVVDASTATVTSRVPTPDVPQINAILPSDDAIWVTDHDAGAVLRVDPKSGKVVARIEIGGRAVSLVETEEGVWAGSGHIYPASVALIDPATDRVTRRLDLGAFPVYGDGTLWFGRDAFEATNKVRRIDPGTGDERAVIKVADPDHGCYVGGSLEEAVWSWCLKEWIDTEAARLDPDANTVLATVELGSGGGLFGVTDGYSWFWADPKGDLPARILRVDNRTNQMDRVYADPPMSAFAAGSLWTLDPDAGELRSIPLDDL
jgi:streptogramin lyase